MSLSELQGTIDVLDETPDGSKERVRKRTGFSSVLPFKDLTMSRQIIRTQDQLQTDPFEDSHLQKKHNGDRDVTLNPTKRRSQCVVLTPLNKQKQKRLEV